MSGGAGSVADLPVMDVPTGGSGLRWPGPELPGHGWDAQAAEVWCARVCAAASGWASATARWVSLVAEFDRSKAWSGAGIASCAQWLSWACSVAIGTAREHLRVGRALAGLPLIDAAFQAGELSFSKVRELTRISWSMDEGRLLALARVCTASQLERSVRAYRRCAADGVRVQVQRRAAWRVEQDGSVLLTARLPAEEGAELVAAMQQATQVLVARRERAGEQQASVNQPDALLEVARGYLAAAPVDASGADTHLVVVHVDAELLAGREAATDGSAAGAAVDVPAGTPPAADGHRWAQ